MKNNLVHYLLKRVHHYYPVGMPILYKEYNGYLELREILEGKMRRVQSDEITPWDMLARSIKESFQNYQLYNFGHLQFPSYMLNIELSNNILDDIEIKETIVLCISLLVPYYTFYIATQYTFGLYEIANKKKKKIFFIIHSEKLEDKYAGMVSVIKENVNNYFENHKFLGHKLLFDHTLIGCFPYGLGLEMARNEFTLYDYLFSSDFAGFQYIVYE